MRIDPIVIDDGTVMQRERAAYVVNLVDEPAGLFLALKNDGDTTDKLTCLDGVVLALRLAPHVTKEQAELLAVALNHFGLCWEALYEPPEDDPGKDLPENVVAFEMAA